MKLVIAAVLGLTAATAVQAAPLASYDAFAAFTPASATSGPFTFGQVSGGLFAAYPTGGTCLLQNTVCLTSGDYVGAYKTFDGAAHPGSGTIDVPADALILHPGNNGEVSTIVFTAPTAGRYRAVFSAFQATNTNANSVDLLGYFGGYGTPIAVSTLTAANPSFSVTQNGIILAAGQSFAVGVGAAGNYQYDSTGVNLTVTAVPEPAAWGLMTLGFGMVGVSLRSRRRTLAAA